MRVNSLDLMGAILIAAINVAWVLLPNRPLAIGIILGVPLVFVLPGYTLAQVLFRKRPPELTSNLILRPSLKIEHPVSAVDHIILSLGLSLAIDVLIGFMLNVFPIGLQALSWTISLGLVTTIFALFAEFLRRRDRVKIESVRTARKRRPRFTIHDCLLFGLAILVATVAVWFSVIRPPATPADFTQFWMLPSKTASSCAVRIGVQNFETTSVSYRITMTMNGVQVNTWTSVVLAPQEEWDQTISIKPEAATSIYIEAQLYRAEKPDSIYRDVHLTMHSAKASKIGRGQQCTS